MKKEYLLFFVSLIVSIIFAIVFLEFYFRNNFWWGNHFTHNGRNNSTQFDSKLGWSNKIGSTFIQDGITYSTNSLGLRSKEIDFSKKHILVVGDSIVWGYGVENNETIPYYLGEKLKDYQIINLGVTGYGIDQYYLFLKRYIDKLNPALIIIVICVSNDYEGTNSDALNGKSKPLFVIDKNKLVVKSGQVQVNPDNLQLTNFDISPNSCTNVFTRSWTLKHPIFQNFRNIICKTRRLDSFESQYVI